jgi:hypothetical protein
MMTEIPKRCTFCRERIRLPEPREEGYYACTDCYGDERSRLGVGNAAVETTEIQYHGGRFHTGEW